MAKNLEEMLEFLDIKARPELKAASLQSLLGLSGSEDGREVMSRSPQSLKALVKLAVDKPIGPAKDALLTLVNISADESGSLALLEADVDIVSSMLNIATDPESLLADPAFMVLSNLSRPDNLAKRVEKLIKSSTVTIEKLVDICADTNHNKSGANLHYAAPLLSNLTQLDTVRSQLLNTERPTLLCKLLPFTEYAESNVRRGGVVGVIRNCCFDPKFHRYLLGSKVDLLPHLLLPLAGPEEFDDEDNEQLPVELQWLPPEKKREDDPDIRKMLLETLQQLCATKESREIMRWRRAYVILRELHKVEKERAVLLCIENVVDILIRQEDEMDPEHENLREVEVPDHLIKTFENMDSDFINDA